MNQKVLKTLEYNKIIHQLTGYAASAPGKLLCQNLLPMSDSTRSYRPRPRPATRSPVSA